jgi:hypothetical protein
MFLLQGLVMASDTSHHDTEVQKVEQPIIWGNVVGILLFHLIAVYGLFTLPFLQIRWQTYLWGEKLPFYPVELPVFIPA